MMAGRTDTDLQVLVRIVAIALLLVTVSNGAGAYLKRTGLVDEEAYLAYWPFHCRTLVTLSPAEIIQPRCCALATREELARFNASGWVEEERAFTRYLHPDSAWEIVLKIAKDLFGIVFFALSAFLLARRSAPFPGVRQAWPIALLLGYSMLAMLASLALHGPLIALAGARSITYLALALVAAWLVPKMEFLANCMAALLVLEALLIPFEVLHGIHLNGHLASLALAGRATGTLVLPNTLGVFAVSALAFYYSFSLARSRLPVLVGLVLVIVFFSGSATGAVCVAMFLLIAAIDRTGAGKRGILLVCGLIAIALLVMALPVVTARPDVFDSIFGAGARVDRLQSALTDRGWFETLFGSGLGINTNASANLMRYGSEETLSAMDRGPADSTVTVLLMQIGVLGTLLFYAMLLWAGLLDQSTRMFYAVVAVCSLTINVTELFPVNFLLGIALARSASKE